MLYLALIALSVALTLLDYSPRVIGNIAVGGAVASFAFSGIYSFVWLVLDVHYNHQSASRCHLIGLVGAAVLIGVHAVHLTCHWSDEVKRREECITGVAASGIVPHSVFGITGRNPRKSHQKRQDHTKILPWSSNFLRSWQRS